MKTYSFEKLDVWQKSRTLVSWIYQISDEFPQAERFGITNQIRRAVVSISCNIAEGNSRSSGKEQARYTEIAFGSLLEVLNLLLLASDLKFVSDTCITE